MCNVISYGAEFDDYLGQSYCTVETETEDFNPFSKKRLIFIGIVSLMAFVYFSYFGTTLLANNSNLLTLFETEFFRGTLEFWNKLPFLGFLMQFVISGSAIISLVMQWITYSLTLLYKSTPGFWDMVEDVKSNSMKGRFLGFEGIFDSIKGEANEKFKGLDVIVLVAASFLLNVKQYTYYASTEGGNTALGMNLEASDSLGQFVIKSFIPVGISTIISCVLFNGSLTQLFGNFASAGCLAFDSMVILTSNRVLTDFMDKYDVLSTVLAEDTTPIGEFRYRVHGSISRKAGDSVFGSATDNSAYAVTNKEAEEWVVSNITYDSISTKAGTQVTEQNLKDWRVNVSVGFAESKDERTWSVPISELTPGLTLKDGRKDKFIHITVTSDRSSGSKTTVAE